MRKSTEIQDIVAPKRRARCCNLFREVARRVGPRATVLVVARDTQDDAAFAGTLLLNRSFARELSNDCLDALIAAPVPASALFLGKALANFLMVLAVELIALPLFGLFYNVRWTKQFPELMMVVVLATWGMTVTGTMFSALTVNIRLREVMLPILNFPILIPLLLGAMQLTSVLVAGKPIDNSTVSWVKMLIGFDVMYTAVSLVLVETVLVG
jgi:heme exporter protein B